MVGSCPASWFSEAAYLPVSGGKNNFVKIILNFTPTTFIFQERLNLFSRF